MWRMFPFITLLEDLIRSMCFTCCDIQFSLKVLLFVSTVTIIFHFCKGCWKVDLWGSKFERLKIVCFACISI